MEKSSLAKSYKRGAKETRGQKRLLTKLQVFRLDQARLRLLKRADGEWRVIHAMIIEEAGYQNVACEQVLQDGLWSLDVGFPKPRAKIYFSDNDAKVRVQIARAWVKRSCSYRSKKAHAYMDNKSFVLPLAPTAQSSGGATHVKITTARK